MNRNAVQEKSYAFAVRVVRRYQHLSDEKREFVLSKQVHQRHDLQPLRSGTSIGANVEEAVGGISKKDFAAKMSIAYKEARETSYWLRLLRDSGYIDETAFDSPSTPTAKNFSSCSTPSCKPPATADSTYFSFSHHSFPIGKP